ncbi:MAG: lysophospholipid acyltransferase family protein [Novosphingobium sp.]|nr:1-acyl-sn-glycerol-3-phosphate acyltransferase [Novosphingobium sp.]
MIAEIIATLLLGVTRFLVGGHARWQGCSPDPGQRIYFANHSSHLDTILLWAALPRPLRRTTHPVAAKDYWGKTAFHRFIAVRVLNAVLLDREGGRDALDPLKETLEQGHSLILFPEGTRQSERMPGPFKGGLFALARAFPTVELVPVYLTNLARAYPKGAILPAPISCIVTFGAPITAGDDERKPQFLARAHKAVCSLAGGERS